MPETDAPEPTSGVPPTDGRPSASRARSRSDETGTTQRRTSVSRSASVERVEIDVDGRALTITNPNKVFFAEIGATKLDLIAYYREVAEAFLRAARGRPTMLQRFPDGADGASFFQKRVPRARPSWLQTMEVATPNGTTSDALVLADLAHVVWAVNLGCLGFHLWPYHAEDPDHADELRLDLDPAPGVEWAQVREAAWCVKALLDEAGIVGLPKTTGSRGIHVYVRLTPRWSSVDVRRAAVAVARELARRHPALITDAWWKEERGARVFVDFNQNAPHKTVFGAWSVRARPHAPVSTPLRWSELDVVRPDRCTIVNVPTRLAADGDPWDLAPHQSLDPLLALWHRDLAAGLRDAPWPPVYPKQPDEPPRVAPSRARHTSDSP